MNKKTKNDIILVLVIIVLGAVMLGAVSLFSKKGEWVEITLDGEHYGIYSLDNDTRVEINGTNVLVIENNSAYMESACCKNQTCVKSPAVSEVGQMIVCLPNKITVTVVDGKTLCEE